MKQQKIKQKINRRRFWLAMKIAIGSSTAIYLAHLLNLDYATSAGSITLLTLITTKWETVRLSVCRILSFGVSVILASLAFLHIGSDWIAYGVFIFVLFFICELLNWKTTLSVNAVIGTHFLSAGTFSSSFILNEFLLVLIGISVAFVLNLFQDNQYEKRILVQGMRDTENNLQNILTEMAHYLADQPMGADVWSDLYNLKHQVHQYVGEAYNYQNNTFHSHPQYYIDYFEMRMAQCDILLNLHAEMRKIRKLPSQSKVISDYMYYLVDYVIEMNVPKLQMEKLQRMIEEMNHESLPVDREEFENRALLYHILMDLEEFLIVKKRFVDGLNSDQINRYWNISN